jgi:hypothetical protein
VSTPKHRRSPVRRRSDRPGWRRSSLIGLSIMLGVGIPASALVLRGGAPWSGATTLVAETRFATLNGRWLRPDGGYVLEIRGAATDGAIEAVYFNPRPINVARAEVAREGPELKVFVELRAPGYPGSTYTLVYDPKRDQLTGTYFQAALVQTFDVFFTRIR